MMTHLAFNYMCVCIQENPAELGSVTNYSTLIDTSLSSTLFKGTGMVRNEMNGY
jgi:hypothetical protein